MIRSEEKIFHPERIIAPVTSAADSRRPTPAVSS
jgi:hypothetical protein